MADILTEAKERWQQATDHYREQKARMLEDLEFSNPADPQQWNAIARAERENAIGGARPCVTLDYTNQYIAQVENDARQNKPGIEISPGDSRASKQAALEIEGHVRQIEYASRADIAYARSISHSSRCGLGWLRAGTKMINPAMNEQEIVIMSVADPLSAMIDEDSTEPDGSDATVGWVESSMSLRSFKKEHGDDSHVSWGSGEKSDKFIRLCEYFYQVKTKTPYLSVELPDGSMRQIAAADREREEQLLQSQDPTARMVVRVEYNMESTQVKWCKLSGSEVLDETDFPSQYIPLIPVYGHELWVDGKRYVCGLTRQLMDGQRLKNFERSAWIETIAQQPRVPWIIPHEAVEQFKQQWAEANRSNAAYLPYNALDREGNALPAPQRNAPPIAPQVFAQGSQQAMEDMQAGVGMYRSNFGAQSNAVSGRAKLADQREGDTATYHYQDNRARSIAHLGRVIVDMLPRVKDTAREARSLSVSGAAKIIRLDPKAAKSYQETNAGPVINPNIGKYEVRCKTGPAYNSLRQEAADNLSEIVGKNPALLSILGPVWARMQDWPESDHVSKLLLAMAPKPVQDIENQDNKIPPEAQAIVTGLQAQLEQMQQAGQQMQAQMEQMQQALVEKQTQTQIAGMAAQSKAEADQFSQKVKIAEFDLKERELSLRERDMTLRERDAERKAQPTQIDVGNLQLDARRVEIEEQDAETRRLKVELDALAGQLGPLLAAQIEASAQQAEAAEADEQAIAQMQEMQSLLDKWAITSQNIGIPHFAGFVGDAPT